MPVVRAVVSLLDAGHDRRVRLLWEQLETACGLRGIAVTPIPHFTWHLAENYDLECCLPALQALAAEIAPFSVRTSGLALFSGVEPVLYLPIVRTGELSALHRQFYNLLAPYSTLSSEYYTPAVWMPHITLAHTDLDAERLSCALHDLLVEPFNWEIPIDNLALVEQEEKQVGRLNLRISLGGGG
jgi:2'-5' RNA ligase